MCYAAPGPRCSRHARAALDRAQQAQQAANIALSEAQAANIALSEAQAAFQRKRMDGLTTEMDPSTDPAFCKASAAKYAADKAVQQAIEDYHATPEGINGLKAQAAKIQEDLGPAALTNREYQDLMGAITRGQERRAEALDLYKTFHRRDMLRGTAPTDGEIDSAADEQTAMEPAPLCSCIVYKHTGECEHVGPAVDHARTELLPTGTEASKDLHDANARYRAAEAHYRDIMEMVRTAGADPRGSRALEKARQRAADARDAVRQAESRFHETPEGQSYARRKADRLQVEGKSNEAYTLRWSASEGNLRRADNIVKYHGMTGKDAPAETVAKPPLPANGAGCPKGCDDFTWTGSCADVDAKPTATAAPVVAIPTQRRGFFSRLRDRLAA